MRLKTILTSVTALLVTLCMSGQKLTRNVGTVPDGYNFWLYAPDGGEDAGHAAGGGDDAVELQKKPVFIFLHGASLCGNNLDKVRRYGTIDAIEKGRKIDGYVIAPQNPGGSWNPRKVMNILDWVEDNYDVDKDRVYVLGMSLGGYGTIDVAASYPPHTAMAAAMRSG